MLDLKEKYCKLYDLKRYVLCPAIEEINNKTDIFVYGNSKIYNKNITLKNKSNIIVDSMLQTGDKGKAKTKIFFHVKNNNH